MCVMVVRQQADEAAVACPGVPGQGERVRPRRKVKIQTGFFRLEASGLCCIAAPCCPV